MMLPLFKLAQLIDTGHLPGGGRNATETQLQTILTIIFTSLGALAVLLIVIAGLRYILAAGESQKVAQAKSSIFYALIGLVLAAAADAIVNFVIGKL